MSKQSSKNAILAFLSKQSLTDKKKEMKSLNTIKASHSFDVPPTVLRQSHVFQVSHFDRGAPVLGGQLPPSQSSLKSLVLRWSWLECQIFMTCLSCSYPPSLSPALDSYQQKLSLLCHYRKKCHPRVWKSIQFVIFKPWKTLWNSIDYIIEIPVVMFGGYSKKLSQRHCEIQLSRGNLGEQNVLESAFSGFQRA